MLPKRFHLKPSSFLALNSAGPNYNPSVLGLSLDAFAFTKASEPCEAFMAYAELSANNHLSDALKQEMDNVRNLELKPGVLPVLGKLHEKVEAAGKVRVFAITDGWTQSLLSGLHDAIFEVLKFIPQDGT